MEYKETEEHKKAKVKLSKSRVTSKQHPEHRRYMQKVFEGRPKCGATKQNGDPCRALAITGKTRCRSHGGRTKRGVKSGTFLHGKRSLVLPRKIAEKYEEALADPRLVELRDDIALWEARIQLLSKTLKKGESRRFVGTAKRYLTECHKALKQGKIKGEDVVNIMHGFFNKKINEHDNWDELKKATEIKRKLVASETKRMKDIGAVLTLEQTLAFLALISYEVKKYIKGQDLLDFQHSLGKHLSLTGTSFQQDSDVKNMQMPVIEEMMDKDEDGDLPYSVTEGRLEAIDVEAVE